MFGVGTLSVSRLGGLPDVFGLGQYRGSTELPRHHMRLEESTGGAWTRQKCKEWQENPGLWICFDPQLSLGLLHCLSQCWGTSLA